MAGKAGGLSEVELCGLVEAVYDAAVDAERWPEALQRLMLASGGVGGSLFEPYNLAFNPRRIVTPSLAEKYAESAAKEYWRIEPRVRRTRESARAVGALRQGAVLTDTQLFSERELDTDCYYQEFLRPHGLRNIAFFWVNVEGRSLVCLVERSLKNGAFKPEELQRLAWLRGHLERSLNIGVQLARARRMSHGLFGMLESLGVAALLLGAGGQVLFANRAAERLEGNAITLHGRKLASITRSDNPALDRLVGSVLTSPTVPSDLPSAKITRWQDGHSLLVQVLPLSEGGKGNELLLSSARALVLITDPAAESHGDPRKGLRLLGLTRAEANIAYWAGRGFAAADVADRVGNTVGTVRFTLKRIYSKLGVSRQSELALLVAKLSSIAAIARSNSSSEGAGRFS